MKMISARHAWHWAFLDDQRSIDFRDVLNEWGVQFTARGADNRIMDHVEKGMIQQAVALLKERDQVAWAWGMVAYAPPGTAHGFERAVIGQWLRDCFYAHADHAEFAGYRHTVNDVKLRTLALIAALDVAHEDVTGHRRRRKYADLARAISVPGGAEEYQRDWHRHYVFFRDLVKTLPERALPPVATLVWRICGLRDAEDLGEAQACAEDLRGVLAVKA
jgi:hypothetical protein